MPCWAWLLCAPCWAGLLCVPHGCSGRRRPRLWGPAAVCAGGRRPAGPGCFACPWAAARPLAVRAASLRLGASPRSPARPRHHPPAPRPGPPDPPAPPHRQGLGLLLGNFACNSPTALSKNELTTLELQHFQALLNLRPIELHATFAGVPPLPPLTSTVAMPLKLLRRSPHR